MRHNLTTGGLLALVAVLLVGNLGGPAPIEYARYNAAKWVGKPWPENEIDFFLMLPEGSIQADTLFELFVRLGGAPESQLVRCLRTTSST